MLRSLDYKLGWYFICRWAGNEMVGVFQILLQLGVTVLTLVCPPSALALAGLPTLGFGLPSLPSLLFNFIFFNFYILFFFYYLNILFSNLYTLNSKLQTINF